MGLCSEIIIRIKFWFDDLFPEVINGSVNSNLVPGKQFIIIRVNAEESFRFNCRDNNEKGITVYLLCFFVMGRRLF